MFLKISCLAFNFSVAVVGDKQLQVYSFNLKPIGRYLQPAAFFDSLCMLYDHCFSTVASSTIAHFGLLVLTMAKLWP